jgi:rare lipoprotein A
MALIIAAAASLAACASVDRGPAPGASAGGYKVGKPYQVNGVWYVPRVQPGYNEVGVASWYGDAFHLKATASGEIFDMNAVSGAHTTLPLPCIVEVTNLENGRKLKVRVNDRGPFVGDRIIDLSHEAARELGYDRQGLAKVRVRYIGPAPLLGPGAGVRVARAAPPRHDRVQASPVQMASAAPPPRPRWTPSPTQSANNSYRDQAAFTSGPGPVAARQLDVEPTLAAAQSAAGSSYRIQAGAFSEEARARRVAAQLSSVGAAVVEPVERDGLTFYRVVLPAPQDQLQAYNLRQKVAEAGFTDARVVGPF